MPSKMKNKKTRMHGRLYDSRAEARYSLVLEAKLKKGEISNLEYQRPFLLIPSQKTSKGTLRKTEYYADFCYNDKDGNFHVIDVKGNRTDDYMIKRKLMLYLLGLEIEEVEV